MTVFRRYSRVFLLKIKKQIIIFLNFLLSPATYSFFLGIHTKLSLLILLWCINNRLRKKWEAYILVLICLLLFCSISFLTLCPFCKILNVSTDLRWRIFWESTYLSTYVPIRIMLKTVDGTDDFMFNPLGISASHTGVFPSTAKYLFFLYCFIMTPYANC